MQNEMIQVKLPVLIEGFFLMLFDITCDKISSLDIDWPRQRRDGSLKSFAADNDQVSTMH